MFTAAMLQTVAACRKSHCVHSVSHERSQPVRRHARVPHFNFDDSTPHIGSPTFRCISRQATRVQTPASWDICEKTSWVTDHICQSCSNACSSSDPSSLAAESNSQRWRHIHTNDHATVVHPFAALSETDCAWRSFKWRARLLWQCTWQEWSSFARSGTPQVILSANLPATTPWSRRWPHFAGRLRLPFTLMAAFTDPVAACTEECNMVLFPFLKLLHLHAAYETWLRQPHLVPHGDLHNHIYCFTPPQILCT